MIDARLNRAVRLPLQYMALRMHALGLKANHLTWTGFLIGIGAVPLIAWSHFELALVAILLNRLFDGLDGALARIAQPTDRGAFLDITLDFLFYGSIPLAFGLTDPTTNALAAAMLLFAFVGTGTSFLAFAVLAGQRGMTSTAFSGKGFYYLGGLTESTETIAVFALMCLVPAWFSTLAYAFAALCFVTVVTRIAAGVHVFR